VGYHIRVRGSGRSLLSIGEYKYNSGQAGLPAATIGRRFHIEAAKT